MLLAVARSASTSNDQALPGADALGENGLRRHDQACIFLGKLLVALGRERMRSALRSDFLFGDARAIIFEIVVVQVKSPPGLGVRPKHKRVVYR